MAIRRTIKTLLAFLLLLLPCSAWATTTVTGHVADLGGVSQTSNTFVRFTLRGCAGGTPRVLGTALIAPTQGAAWYKDFPADSSGNVSGTIYSTRDSTGLLGGDIDCNGSKLGVWYGMTIWQAGKSGPEIPVHAKNTGTLDVTQVTPITTNPVIIAPAGDSTYLRLDGGNSPETGNVAFTGNNTFTGPFTATNPCAIDGQIYVSTAGCYTTITAAIAAASAGATIYSPPGHAETLSSAIAVNKSVTLILDGNAITNTGTINGLFTTSASNITIDGRNSTTLTLVGTNTVAVQLTGTASNITIQNLIITGDAVVADHQIGIYYTDVGTNVFTNLQFLHNTISGTTEGIVLNSQTLSSAKGVLIRENYITGIVGTVAPDGYGIASAGAPSQPADVRILNNYLELVQRHSIYVSQGAGAVVAGNTIRLHRQAVANSTSTPAIVIGRSQNVSVANNILDTPYDGGIIVFTDTAGTACRNITLTGNSIYNSQFYDIQLGTTTPATDNFCTGVTLSGNTLYKTNINQFGLYIASGKDILINGNTFQSYITTSYGVRIEGAQETAGTALYTDRLFFYGNNIFTSNGSDTGVGFAATAAASGINMQFVNNKITSNGQPWFASGGAGITDPNIKLFNTDYLQNANGFLTTVANKPLISFPLAFPEQAAPAAAVGQEVCYPDATAHALECSYNNGTFGVVPLLNRAQTWTAAQTHTGAAIIPDQTSGITGTTTNNNANAGAVGEYVQSVLATGSSVTLTTGVTSNVTSISLTAGDWDVTGAVDFTFGATTSYTNLIGSVSTTTGTIGGQDSKFDFETPAAVPTAAADATFPLPVVRFSLSGTTTVFLVAQGTFTVSTLKAYGTIRARRIR